MGEFFSRQIGVRPYHCHLSFCPEKSVGLLGIILPIGMLLPCFDALSLLLLLLPPLLPFFF